MKKMIACVFAVMLLGGAMAVASGHGKELYDTKCAGCHGDDGTKTAATGGVVVKGLSSEEALEKMQGYLDGTYGGKKARMMTGLLKRFDEAEIKSMADYIGTL